MRLRRIRLPCRGRGMLGIRFRLAAIPPLGVTAFRYTASARPNFQPSEKLRALRLCEAESSEYWKIRAPPVEGLRL